MRRTASDEREDMTMPLHAYEQARDALLHTLNNLATFVEVMDAYPQRAPMLRSFTQSMIAKADHQYDDVKAVLGFGADTPIPEE